MKQTDRPNPTTRSCLIRTCYFVLRVATIAFAFCGASCNAYSAAPYGDTLTGDWGGIRSTLRDDGIDFTIGYTSETAYNAQGGPARSTLYTDQISLGFALDLQRLMNLNAAKFQLSISDRNGHNLSGEQKLNTLQQVQELYGRGQTWLITQFWYEQSYYDKKMDWKVGRMTVGEDFASFSCDFMNLTFCGAAPGNIVGNYWYNWPISQWATRLRADLPGFGYMQIGGYVVDPNYLLQRYAFTLAEPPDAKGALIPFEIGWLPHFGTTRLPGSYKAGAWANTSRTADVFYNTLGRPLVLDGGSAEPRNGAYGGYFDVHQQLTRTTGAPEQGLSFFLNTTIADRRTSTIDNQVAMGLVLTGMWPSRPRDDVAIAFGRTHVNSRVARSEELAVNAGLNSIGVQTSEYVGEVYYSLRTTHWLLLRPNLQFIHQPDGLSHQVDDIVIGLKVVVGI